MTITQITIIKPNLDFIKLIDKILIIILFEKKTFSINVDFLRNFGVKIKLLGFS